MPGQPVYEFESFVVSSTDSSPASPDIHRGSLVSICDSPAFSRVAADDSDSNRDGLGCLRGLRSAFALEAVMALLVYGVWHLWHMGHLLH